MKFIMFLAHSVLLMGTFSIAANHWGEFGYAVPEWLHTFVMIGVVGISVVWAVGHLIAGGVMGVAAGGVGEGIKLGLFLGLAISVGRLWPYLMVLALASFFQASWIYPLLLGIGSIACLGIDIVTRFVWSRAAP